MALYFINRAWMSKKPKSIKNLFLQRKALPKEIKENFLKKKVLSKKGKNIKL